MWKLEQSIDKRSILTSKFLVSIVFDLNIDSTVNWSISSNIYHSTSLFFNLIFQFGRTLAKDETLGVCKRRKQNRLLSALEFFSFCFAPLSHIQFAASRYENN